MNIPSFGRWACLLAGLLFVNSAAAAESPKNSGAAAAKCASVSGVLLAKQPGASWKAVQAGATVPSGTVLVGAPRAELTSISGAIQVRLLADIGQRGPFPVLETGITLHDAAGLDMDLTAGRGLIV